jgi:hypothetical protein
LRRLFSRTFFAASVLITTSAARRLPLNQTVTPKPQASAAHRITVTGIGRNEARVSTQKKNNIRIIHMASAPDSRWSEQALCCEMDLLCRELAD